MSLSEKVIKNTFYYIIFQLLGFAFPLILTPLIISKIGEVQYGIYIIVFGFVGIFGLFDLSLSSSFIIFISRFYIKKDFLNLNKYFNTGLFFYIIFSSIIVIAGFLFSQSLLSFLNIPEDLYDKSVKIYYIGLLIFFISSSFTIFISVLIALQKMYVTSASGIFVNTINAVLTILVLSMGYGLEGLMWIQLFTVIIGTLINIYYALSSIPELSIRLSHLSKEPMIEMSKFGSQMQISKLAGFVSEKYDEFLLAYFSALNNVTNFNVANRIAKTGRLIPFQIIAQVAPVASELSSKNESEKLTELYQDTTKYLNLVTLPVFVFIIIFSDLIITTWLGPGYDLSSRILKILAFGQIINLTFSAPGNSIIPNTGFPKYQMYEGFLYLGINIILSFVLIKYYGILGASVGNSLSLIISSVFIFIVSAKFFKQSKSILLISKYIKPVIVSLVSGIIVWIIYFLSDKFLYPFSGRISGLLYIFILGGIFMLLFSIWIINSEYINSKDKLLIAKVLLKIIPAKFLKNGKRDNSNHKDTAEYDNELVSIFIVTHNRLDFIKKCTESLLQTLDNINYELIIIDNASTDGTIEYLNKLSFNNKKVRLIKSEINIGTNAKSVGAESSKGEFIIGIDDDVIFFPENWIQKMVKAYKNIPDMGYLATDVVQDETTNGAKPTPDFYYKESYDNGNVILEVGPTGGWCFMISREVYQKIGKFLKFEGRIFFPEDGDYVNRIINNGLKYGILSGVKVYHATGEFHNKNFMKIYEQKHKDFKIGDPFFYSLINKSKRLLSLRRYITKLKEYSNKNSL